MNRDNSLVDGIVQNALSAASSNARSYKLGLDYAEVRHRTIMKALASCYEKTLTDPTARIPTALEVMLEAVRQTVRGYEQEAVAHPDAAARHAGL